MLNKAKPTLSDREHQVLLGLIADETEACIALRLGISRKSVSDYKARIRTKMNMRSTVAAVAKAVRFGLDRNE